MLGPHAGVATVRSSVEVISDSTAGTDRIIKVREYAAVASVLRYVLIESTLAGVTVLSRKKPDEIWGTSTLTIEDSLQLPEVSMDIPVAELYRDLTFPADHVPAEA